MEKESPAQYNRLYRYLGDMKFEDVTEAAGVREGGLTLGAAFADYDRDGDIDIYAPSSLAADVELRGEDVELVGGLELEGSLFSELFGTDDMREGTAAFLEKRKPVFTGK